MKSHNLLTLFLICFTQIAFTQSTTDSLLIEEIVIQENRLQLPVSDASHTINIISRQQIQNSPARSVAEVLQNVAGIDIRQRGVHGVQSDVSIRGGTFDQALILINGIKMADPQTGHHAMNIPLDLDNIERIEVLKGPAARVFGANAFSGAINIVTKTPNKTFSKINIEAGQNGLGGIAASTSFGNDKYKQFFSASRNFSQGYRHNTDYSISNYFYQSEFKINNSQSLNFLGSFTDREFGANRFYGNTSEAFANQYEEVRTSLFNVGHKKVTDNMVINTRFNWRHNEDEYVFLRNNPSVFRNFHVSDVFSLESHANIINRFGTTGVGVELSRVDLRSNNLGKHNRNIATLFLEHRVSFLDEKLDIRPGIAISHYSDFGTHIFPGLDVGFEITEGLKLFGNAGYTWRIPTFTDLFYEDGANIGNENLQPESALSYEAGIKYNQSGLNIQASYFVRNGSDLIDWTKEADTLKWQPQNFANVNMNGFDVSLSFNPRVLLGTSFLQNFTLGYTSINAEIPDNNVEFSRYVLENLNHQLTANIQHRIFGKLFHSFQIRWVDRVSMDDYTLLDSRLSWQEKKWSVYLNANNILDTKYFETNLVEMPGTWIYGGVKIRFGK